MDFQRSLEMFFPLQRYIIPSTASGGHVCLLATITAQGKSTLRHRRPHAPTRLNSTGRPQSPPRKSVVTQAAPSRHPRRHGSAGVFCLPREGRLRRSQRGQIAPDTSDLENKLCLGGVERTRSIKPALMAALRPATSPPTPPPTEESNLVSEAADTIQR